MTELLLVRHGETDWNREHRVQGHTDVPLNAVGRAQAEALAESLADALLAGVYSSDLARARQTAEIVVPAPGTGGRSRTWAAGEELRQLGRTDRSRDRGALPGCGPRQVGRRRDNRRGGRPRADGDRAHSLPRAPTAPCWSSHTAARSAPFSTSSASSTGGSGTARSFGSCSDAHAEARAPRTSAPLPGEREPAQPPARNQRAARRVGRASDLSLSRRERN